MTMKPTRPHDWLINHVCRHAARRDTDALLSVIDALMWRLDGESITDLFQLTHAADGTLTQDVARKESA